MSPTEEQSAIASPQQSDSPSGSDLDNLGEDELASLLAQKLANLD